MVSQLNLKAKVRRTLVLVNHSLFDYVHLGHILYEMYDSLGEKRDPNSSDSEKLSINNSRSAGFLPAPAPLSDLEIA